MLIRQETKEDHDQVYELVKTAFSTIEHSDGNEQNLVAALRKGESFVPELSLVAEIDGQIAGHIMFTEGKVGQNTVLVLAPLSVLPEYQKQGVGTALIAEGHKAARELGYQYALVLGSEKYYPRSGYIPAQGLGIEVPDGMPEENFMAIQLQEKAQPIRGAVTYAKEFGI
ncbi:GNAT family N-acetyltransferase [Desulfitobacterium chlororespirans]|uniref:Predicted N-acetyltransferase YhbS n=1 Tax=Desulfitobacterium chlororespirans DSM 11544 TaxID=1121395 RepID=A0A1M7UKD6_9FIRM|nr:N-acetyltransferase [Desulfitobacterium chlororespirans]SHN83493.1 Predicted N-acetyltransferase YhbS [Desulfitobacterium chlororespirans DSM 11544]